jgi:hypothetical protein
MLHPIFQLAENTGCFLFFVSALGFELRVLNLLILYHLSLTHFTWVIFLIRSCIFAFAGLEPRSFYSQSLRSQSWDDRYTTPHPALLFEMRSPKLFVYPGLKQRSSRSLPTPPTLAFFSVLRKGLACAPGLDLNSQAFWQPQNNWDLKHTQPHPAKIVLLTLCI